MKQTRRTRVLVTFGTRPEAIKMAPVVLALRNRPEQFETLVCVTAQHREMLDQVLQLFSISADYDLNIMQNNQDLYDITSSVLRGMRTVLRETKPDLVLVHGDTTTTFAASLAGFYEKVRVGHVEAGLRTRNIYSPWPEEMNRQLTGRIAELHFAPTPSGKRNLLDEGIHESQILVTGNTAIDALYLALKKIDSDENLAHKVRRQLASAFGDTPFDIDQLGTTRPFVLITGHRRENFGSGFEQICAAIREIASRHPDFDFVYPVHLNPNVTGVVLKTLSGFKNIHLISPLSYQPFVYLMSRCYFILTDSGGIQEEAPSLGKPVLVMRETTERPEALVAGSSRLVGTNFSSIVEESEVLFSNQEIYSKMSQISNPYGDGHASERIVAEILQRFSIHHTPEVST